MSKREGPGKGGEKTEEAPARREKERVTNSAGWKKREEAQG